MIRETLMDQHVDWFSTQPENLAIEALHEILSGSAARRAFLRYLKQVGVEAPDLSFGVHATGAGRANPDLVGTNAAGQPVVIVEAKFWAGLTAHQPTACLRRLPQDTPSVLLFLAPSTRFPTLWPELLQRCKLAGMTVGPERRFSNDFVATGTGPARVLALASWVGVLSYMEHAASKVVELRQIFGRLNDETFLPLRSEEITADTGRRIVQLSQLVDEVADRAVSEGLVSTAGLRTAASRTGYGRHMWIHGWGGFLHWDASKWGYVRATPIWLTVKDGDWKTTSAVRDRLSTLEFENPSRLLLVEGEYCIPLRLPQGVQKVGVVDSLLAQLREIARLISHQPASNPHTS